MNPCAGQQWRHRQREQTYERGVGEDREGGIQGESNIETYTLPYGKQIAHGNLRYDSGNSNWGSVTTQKKTTYKKDLHDQDNHDGVITHLQPDIPECEVKWALESITTNKASGSDGIPVELFQILKDGAVKVLHSICQQIWKTQQWPQDWKRSVFIPIPKKKEMPKNVQTTTQLHSSHTLVK